MLLFGYIVLNINCYKLLCENSAPKQETSLKFIENIVWNMRIQNVHGTNLVHTVL
jgi:hypothetical protein